MGLEDQTGAMCARSTAESDPPESALGDGVVQGSNGAHRHKLAPDERQVRAGEQHRPRGVGLIVCIPYCSHTCMLSIDYAIAVTRPSLPSF